MFNLGHFLLVAHDQGGFAVGGRIFRTDHGHMLTVRYRIFIAVYHIKFADFIFRTGHGIVDTDQL